MKTSKQELLDKAEELKQQIENIDKEELLLPKPEGIIYCIYTAGKVYGDYAVHYEAEITHYNYFDTEEEAEEEAAFTRARRKLQKLAKVLNGKWKPDWADRRQHKHSIYYSMDTKRYDADYNWHNQYMDVYFSSNENALRALEELTEDEKKILFRRSN